MSGHFAYRSFLSVEAEGLQYLFGHIGIVIDAGKVLSAGPYA